LLRFLFLAAAAIGCSASAPASDTRLFVPVLRSDFADPFVLPHKGEFLAYATNAQGGRANVPMARSTNLTDWALIRQGGKLHDAMPVLPPWAREGYTWAPEVIATSAGYVLYFTAKERKSGLQCIGAAFAPDPRGPFRSDATEPLVCQREIGGTIDASPFRDADGALYLYYKNDGNHPDFRKPTDIFGQRLSADGLKLEGAAVALLRNDAPWEEHVIEAPTMVKLEPKAGGGYTMFYSANHFGWEPHQRLSPYATGYARCEGALGPCRDGAENPLLFSYNGKPGCLSGPGHQSVFEANGRHFISFHAWAPAPGCARGRSGRELYIAPLGWKGGVPQIGASLRGVK
jgi:beta-xylosidase